VKVGLLACLLCTATVLHSDQLVLLLLLLLLLLLQMLLRVLLQSGMARPPGDPALLVMYANFLIVHKSGQAARTQIRWRSVRTPHYLACTTYTWRSSWRNS
jgi:hypothetical protein